MASFDNIASRLGAFDHPTLKPRTLDAALERVTRIEGELMAAREEAKGIARGQGKKTSGPFGDSRFVLRSTAESWCDEVRNEVLDAVDRSMANGSLQRAFQEGMEVGRAEQAKRTAEQIILAGKKRRGEI
jgi:hypothetical protein